LSGSDARRIVVVGTSLAGVRTAQALRLKGGTEPITLIGAENELPYDLPPLSKAHLASGSPAEPVRLLSAEELAALNLDLRLGTRATGLDPTRRLVLVDVGEAVPYDVLVVATGARARLLPLAHGLSGVHVLRTLQDAERLRADLDGYRRLAVIGGGFIGAEVAVAARDRGLDVTMIEMLPAPMSRGLGPEVGELLAQMHRAHGVDVRCNTTVTALRGRDGRVTELELSDGTVVAADVVVAGLGATPETGWLAGSGLDISDGVLCDEHLRAVGLPDVYAAGDVARWYHPGLDRTMRVEHWTSAQEHASVVAAGILGEHAVADALPYVWSDQYRKRIQIIGRAEPGDRVTVIADPVEGRHVAAYSRDGRLTAALAIDDPRTLMKARRAVTKGETVEELVARLG
jgi:NADPH-dependent 2,4-dienoyl-CoA reductase/sulfur reductase-like enzyme